ncbi:hypothetical protein HYFRA_00003772 [Hymenoscyphus fraxineus]|uniref:Uncharacterized protein n=1 Tax=Hymenoscyphus fraxineus TaxID=746836 RepID=A0A9N9PJY4_9HELO|nr:hypothetical protein HYFRA_00003772 [Hymenoscyphus fraxineus]
MDSTSHQFDFRLTHAAVSATSDHDEDKDDGPASASATGNPVHAHDQPVSDHLECSLALPPRDACPAPEVMVMTDIPSGSRCTLLALYQGDVHLPRMEREEVTGYIQRPQMRSALLPRLLPRQM